jgi:LysM repeat protein
MRRYTLRVDKSSIILCLTLLGVAGCAATNNTADSEATKPEIAPAVETAEKPAESMPKSVLVDVANEKQVPINDLPTPPSQNNVTLRPTAPEQYIVQKGDTLWDISSKFLAQPWFWPEIWYVNPQVENPHLIYPGDVINVFYVNGRPYLTLNDDSSTQPAANTARMSPRIRGEAINVEDKIIPIQAIEQFLIRPQVVTKEELDESPHVVGSRDNRLVYGAGDEIYIRDAKDLNKGGNYNIYRPENEFVDPDTGEVLGYQAIHIGDGQLVKEGDIGTLLLIATHREVLRGDRVLPVDESEADTTFTPKSPDRSIDGKVIHLYEAISQVGSYQIVVTSVGTRDGIQKGDVISIAQAGRITSDPFADDVQADEVLLPDEETAVALVFRTFDKVSYAFIMNANRPVRMGDKVRNPE